MSKKVLSLWLFIGLLLTTAPLALAQESFKEANVTTELLLAQKEFQPGKSYLFAVQFSPEKDWHLYGENAGEVGTPPQVEFEVPSYITITNELWPTPIKVVKEDFLNYYYPGQFALLYRLEVSPQAPLESFDLTANVQYLSCYEECIFGQGQLKTELTLSEQATQADPSLTQTLQQYQQLLPQKATGQSKTSEKAIEFFFPQISQKPQYFIPQEAYTFDEKSPAQWTAHNDGWILSLPLLDGVDTDQVQQPLKGLLLLDEQAQEGIYFTFTQVDNFLQASTGSEGESSTSEQSLGFQGILIYLLSGFIGGMILNLMPCVFPVLSLKILGFVNDKDSRWSPTQKGLVFSAGIIISFWLVALAMILLRSTGEQLGWGFQLQSPLFLSSMTLLFCAIGLNLLGVFEIGESLGQAQDIAAKKDGLAKPFFNGFLATLIATPCTAPGMATALGATLQLPWYLSFLIFTSIGLGMSFPYIILSSFPALLSKLPKPGAWMETFKMTLAFPMFLTCTWLLWVLGQQTSIHGMTAALFGLIFFSFALWIWGRYRWETSKTKRWSTTVLAIVIALFSFYLTLQVPLTFTPSGESELAGERWQTFSPQKIEESVREGKAVFVDYTAAWCLTCQVNEKTTLSQASIQQLFKEKEIEMFKADYTNRSDEITRSLESFDRNGVPLYLLYLPGEKEPRILPQILTPAIVEEALSEVP